MPNKTPPKKINSRSYNVYVVELEKEVLSSRKFMEKNPDYKYGQACFYVGMTGRTPDERFDQHKEGYKANKYVKKYGIGLKCEAFEKFNPMTYQEAADLEVKLAEDLRAKGFAVWQN